MFKDLLQRAIKSPSTLFTFVGDLVRANSGKSSSRAGMLLGSITTCAAILWNMVLLSQGKLHLDDWSFVALCGIAVTGGTYAYQKGKALAQPDTSQVTTEKKIESADQTVIEKSDISTTEKNT